MLNSGINKVILLGRVDGEPKIKQVGDEEMFCFTLVTTEQFKKNGHDSTHHEFHQVRASIKLNDIKNIIEGKILYLQGRLRTQQELDENSVKRYSTYVNAYAIEHIDVKLLLVK